MTTTDEVHDIQSEAVDLWIKSYQGEVFGEAYFSHMAAHAADGETRAKLGALVVLERCTKELLAPSMERLGISTAPDQSLLDGAASVTDYDYRTMLEAVPLVTAEYLGYYSRLRQLVEEVDGGVADLLVAHELALELFARRELAGDTDTSLQPIRALSHVTL
jgi:hypothetical protein